jgi:prepilin-type N-terminal cleavage/methylation domain-containing protein
MIREHTPSSVAGPTLRSGAAGSQSGAVASEAGFSLPELLIATAVMLIISSTATSGLLQLTHSQQTIWNRTEMHSGVRSATELLQQEIGQAGRIALPQNLKVQSAIAAGALPSAPVVAAATPIPRSVPPPPPSPASSSTSC